MELRINEKPVHEMPIKVYMVYTLGEIYNDRSK